MFVNHYNKVFFQEADSRNKKYLNGIDTPKTEIFSSGTEIHRILRLEKIFSGLIKLNRKFIYLQHFSRSNENNYQPTESLSHNSCAPYIYVGVDIGCRIESVGDDHRCHCSEQSDRDRCHICYKCRDARADSFYLLDDSFWHRGEHRGGKGNRALRR